MAPKTLPEFNSFNDTKRKDLRSNADQLPIPKQNKGDKKCHLGTTDMF